MYLNTSLLQDVIHLVYPHQCNGCGSDLLERKELLCTYCIKSLPHTNFAKLKNNMIEEIFSGRLDIQAAHSEFYFSKGQLIQHLIHQLKYKNNQEIGFYLGALMGKTLMKSERFEKIDILIPLPMHKEKEIKRGYNQATIIANGIASIIQIPVLSQVIIRNRLAETQTQKHRAERWKNVADSFVIANKESIKGKNILLIDDVITTGATLEACGKKILEIEGTRLSIATLALASK